MQEKIYLKPETNAVAFCFFWHTISRRHVHEKKLTENLKTYTMFKIILNYGILKVSGSKS